MSKPKKYTQEEIEALEKRCAILEAACKYVAEFGLDRPPSRLKRVCEMSLKGMDPRTVLR